MNRTEKALYFLQRGLDPSRPITLPKQPDYKIFPERKKVEEKKPEEELTLHARSYQIPGRDYLTEEKK